MRALLYITISLLLLGCASHKATFSKSSLSASKDSVNVSNKEDIDIEKHRVLETEQDSVSSDVSEVILVFDTDKAEDANTGLYPLKELRIKNITSKKMSDKSKLTLADIIGLRAVNDSVSSKANLSHLEEVRVEKKSRKGKLTDILYIVLIVGTYFLADYVRQRWDKIKALWQTISNPYQNKQQSKRYETRTNTKPQPAPRWQKRHK
ncbi:MAG: hypothetical protein Q3992_02210 [Bacteroides sp.]|nr:hypothetical protein [Bacteroides sp.]